MTITGARCWTNKNSKNLSKQEHGMKTSESIAKIATAMLEAQKAITFASKDATNPHFKNRYADLPAVVDAVKPALNDAGIAFIQSAGPSDDSKLHLTTRLIHTSGEWIEDTLVMPLPKQDPQGYGSAMTYARRYALAAITGLYQDDDDGNAGSGIGKKDDSVSAKQMETFVSNIGKCESITKLTETGDAIGTFQLTEAQRKTIATAYTTRKRELKALEAA
jgi:hypothetical protein